VVGFINWCSNADLHGMDDYLQRHTEIGVHEALHAMGYSSNSWSGQLIDPSLSGFLSPDGSAFLPLEGMSFGDSLTLHC
jgi:hypothetical protein